MQVIRERNTDGRVTGTWRVDRAGELSRAPEPQVPARRARFASGVGGALARAGARAFLPEGFPDSVRPEYLTFQAWDSVQALCSYLRGILATTAIFEAVGVGDEAASPLAAAVVWVMRDGFAMLGSLVFAYLVGGRFDEGVKEWRLFADVINDVGLCLDMAAPLLPGHFALVAAVGAMCKSMCGIAAGATRASITAHFALRDNLADVSTKEGAQETAVSLLGLLAGLALARHARLSAAGARGVFAALTAIHVLANYRAVRCLRLASLNAQRAALLVDALLDQLPADRGAIGARERLVRWPAARAAVRLGAPIAETFRGEHAGAALAAAVGACAGERHLLWPVSARTVHVLLADGATDAEQLRAFAHARLLLRAAPDAVEGAPPSARADVDAAAARVAAARAELADALYPRLLEAIAAHGWNGARVQLGADSWRYEWGDAADGGGAKKAD